MELGIEGIISQLCLHKEALSSSKLNESIPISTYHQSVLIIWYQSIDPDMASLPTNTRNKLLTMNINKLDEEVRQCARSLKDFKYDHILSLLPKGDKENKEGSSNSNGMDKNGHLQTHVARLDFPKFSVKEPTSWIFRANQFLQYQRTMEDERLIFGFLLFRRRRCTLVSMVQKGPGGFAMGNVAEGYLWAFWIDQLWELRRSCLSDPPNEHDTRISNPIWVFGKSDNWVAKEGVGWVFHWRAQGRDSSWDQNVGARKY